MTVTAPTTLEGHYALHFAYAFDWQALQAMSAGDRAAMASEAAEWFAASLTPGAGGSGLYSLVGGKGDLFVMHLRPTIDEANAAEIDFKRLSINKVLTQTYCYLSVAELSSHGDPLVRREGMLKRQGLEPGTDDWDLGMESLIEADEENERLRLRPDVPEHRYLCFYPMSKKRDEQVNWYKLSQKERGQLMRSHAIVGRKYTAFVLQLVTGSIGFDDWEWGVTLFTDDVIQFKKLIYEMRFDPASSDYALFGPFYVGIQLQPNQLGELLDGRLPSQA